MNNYRPIHHQYRQFGNHAASPTATAAQQQRQNIAKASAVPDILAASINHDALTLEDDRDLNNTSSNADNTLSYDTIPPDIMELVQEYCQKDVTPVTMHTLVHTGRQEVVARTTYTDEGVPASGSLNQRNASWRVLIQVNNGISFCLCLPFLYM